MMLEYLLLFLVLGISSAQHTFESIFSVHTSDVERCPPHYTADSKYIACCSNFNFLTTALAPGSTPVPACCFDSGSTCTGAAPYMYDWSLKSDQGTTTMIPIPPDATKNAPQSTPAAATATSTGSAAGGGTGNSGSNTGGDITITNSNEQGSHNSSSRWNMGEVAMMAIVSTFMVIMLVL